MTAGKDTYVLIVISSIQFELYTMGEFSLKIVSVLAQDSGMYLVLGSIILAPFPLSVTGQ